MSRRQRWNPLAVGRDAGRAQRSGDRFYKGLVTMIREVIRNSGSPRESGGECITGPRFGSRRGVVEMRGLEPLTPSLQRRCSPS